MIEVYKEVKRTEEIENKEFTGTQAVAFAMKSFKSLKKEGSLHITDELLGSYMITLMTMYVPSSIEDISQEVFNDHKKDDGKSSVHNPKK